MDRLTLNWLHGKPGATGQLKARPEDFLVTEDLGFTADGEGEHLLVRLRKKGCNTRFVADALAKFSGIPAREVSFAGMKDRHAVTEQTFCLRVPGKTTPDMSAFTLEGCEVLDSCRHRRKLRIGSLAGNAFTLVLRQISDANAVEQRLEAIRLQGVPNYFGAQRFGRDGNNLSQARRWAAGEIHIRERAKRGFLLSAARSAMFNQVTSERLGRYGLTQVFAGDALQLTGRGSWFVAQSEALPLLQQRVDHNELRITAPLPGDGEWGSLEQALAFEQQCLAEDSALFSLLKRERVSAARRAMLVIPQNLCWRWLGTHTLALTFWLPAGCFATSVVRELIDNAGADSDISE